jgi:hypothetical protein
MRCPIDLRDYHRQRRPEKEMPLAEIDAEVQAYRKYARRPKLWNSPNLSRPR